MFDDLKALPEDTILGVMARFRADPFADKVDLGVGVFRDEAGHTPVLDCVRDAESRLLTTQDTKSYVAPVGRAEFNTLVQELVLGKSHGALAQNRVRTIQAPGGCGALRLGAELIKAAASQVQVHVSDPTWGNHLPLLGGAGLKLARYPYYDAAAGHLCFDAMLQALDRCNAGDVVLLHACCHNPSGADLSPAQWNEVLAVLERRRLMPFVDLAYQGFGTGLEADAHGVRLLAEHLPEMLTAISFSKNFGLYRERVGALILLGAKPDRTDAMTSHVLQIARSIYSMPPDHGAAVAALILADAQQRQRWEQELERMRNRIQSMRRLLSATLRQKSGDGRFDFIESQCGMFSLLGLSPQQVVELRDKHHIYMVPDSRVNIAGITPRNAAYLADALLAVI
ncbi:MAG: aspartate/tyrosine/aromatic aminotransferase [Proteobacteria bacterium]|nr:aspartate/tyrosine/aromatic aminotransferase [Pseudomonadota bacterium]